MKTLSIADALVTVTERFADDLRRLHNNMDVKCITNGYDLDEYSDVQMKLTDNFTITHTGQIFNGKRDPSLLFEVVSKLINENVINKKLIEIRFYGPRQNWINEDIRKYNLDGVISSHGFIPREKALKRQKESQLLLLLLDKDNNEKDVYPNKVFECFGAWRPIIAIGGKEGIIQELLEKTNSGKFA